MNTHDVLAFAVAAEAVRRIRIADPDWAPLLSTDVYPTASRAWPLPDFVITDPTNHVNVAAEFKPPNQSKREYLTGLGQAISYTRDFHYSLLVVPEVADDDYPIAAHIAAVMEQDIAAPLPVGLLRYDPGALSPTTPNFTVTRRLELRATAPVKLASLESSFYAKWREMSPMELGLFLEYLYEEGRRIGGTGTVRDRAFGRLWGDMVAGRTKHWGGGVRNVTNTTSMATAFGKNYRNFVTHLGWCAPDGKLTDTGLIALRIVHQFGAESARFLDHLSNAVLTAGKHLVLINAINEFQDVHGTFEDEADWLDSLEQHLEDEGLLKRNPGRALAAVQMSARGFLKAEKTLWKNLGLIVPSGPRGGRVYHGGRGFIFDWSRITTLLS